jgi:aminoglycoside phosphotransferase (APT) family kinase protein
MAEVAELSRASVQTFLLDAGLIPGGDRVVVEELGGGISNVVLHVSAPNECMVVKQSLPRLRVDADWPFDQRRTLGERDCLTLLGRLVPDEVPQVLYCDEASFALVISCAPPGGSLWKHDLLAGKADPIVAGRAGDLLGRIHRLAAADAGARERFADQTVLVQGRTDPYHVTAAARHPELAGRIEAELERLFSTRRTLTLGDYSPKNLFVYPDRVLAIDFEVAHWGDPAFDVAFCLTHLALKAMLFGTGAEGYLACSERFWRDYRVQEAGELCDEEGVVGELGCLLLARIDGKSPVEYIDDDTTRDAVRALAARLLTAPPETVPEALGEVAEAAHRRRSRG